MLESELRFFPPVGFLGTLVEEEAPDFEIFKIRAGWVQSCLPKFSSVQKWLPKFGGPDLV